MSMRAEQVGNKQGVDDDAGAGGPRFAGAPDHPLSVLEAAKHGDLRSDEFVVGGWKRTDPVKKSNLRLTPVVSCVADTS